MGDKVATLCSTVQSKGLGSGWKILSKQKKDMHTYLSIFVNDIKNDH